MLNFAEQTGSGAVMLVWSFPLQSQNLLFTINTRKKTNNTYSTYNNNTAKRYNIQYKFTKINKQLTQHTNNNQFHTYLLFILILTQAHSTTTTTTVPILFYHLLWCSRQPPPTKESQAIKNTLNITAKAMMHYDYSLPVTWLHRLYFRLHNVRHYQQFTMHGTAHAHVCVCVILNFILIYYRTPTPTVIDEAWTISKRRQLAHIIMCQIFTSSVKPCVLLSHW